ncbi:MAG: hypothetical protein WC604_02865 [Candidatus Gracilibacteria bacterium]
MKNALALTAAMAIASCSEPKTEQPQQDPAPVVEAVDRGIDTPEEAISLVEQWRREGFSKLEGLLTIDGVAVLWDPTKCAGSKTDYANGVMLTGKKAVSGNGVEITQPVHPSLHYMDIRYLRACDDGTTGLAGQPPSRDLIQNSGDRQATYETLSGYIATMAATAAMTTTTEAKEEEKAE